MTASLRLQRFQDDNRLERVLGSPAWLSHIGLEAPEQYSIPTENVTVKDISDCVSSSRCLVWWKQVFLTDEAMSRDCKALQSSYHCVCVLWQNVCLHAEENTDIPWTDLLSLSPSLSVRLPLTQKLPLPVHSLHNLVDVRLEQAIVSPEHSHALALVPGHVRLQRVTLADGGLCLFTENTLACSGLTLSRVALRDPAWAGLARQLATSTTLSHFGLQGYVFVQPTDPALQALGQALYQNPRITSLDWNESVWSDTALQDVGAQPHVRTLSVLSTRTYPSLQGLHSYFPQLTKLSIATPSSTLAWEALWGALASHDTLETVVLPTLPPTYETLSAVQEHRIRQHLEFTKETTEDCPNFYTTLHASLAHAASLFYQEKALQLSSQLDWTHCLLHCGDPPHVALQQKDCRYTLLRTHVNRICQQ